MTISCYGIKQRYSFQTHIGRSMKPTVSIRVRVVRKRPWMCKLLHRMCCSLALLGMFLIRMCYSTKVWCGRPCCCLSHEWSRTCGETRKPLECGSWRSGFTEQYRWWEVNEYTTTEILSKLLVTFAFFGSQHWSTQLNSVKSLFSIIKSDTTALVVLFSNPLYPNIRVDILLNVHHTFLRCWQGEFVWQLRVSLVCEHFLCSHDPNVWIRGDIVRRN